MKRKNLVVLIAAVAMFSLTACGTTANNSSSSNTQTTQEVTQATPQATTPVATKKAPYGVSLLSLYIYNKDVGVRQKSTGFNSQWIKGEDIVSFEAYATDVPSFSFGGSNFKNVWESYWNSFDNHDKCKIGYIVDFKLKSGEEIKKTIKGPDDVFSYRNYLECYLYDDVNQIQGNWYSHLLSSQVTDKTVMTSIKFTAGTDIAQVGNTITLTAFVYSSDSDFDTQGNYTGSTSYTVTVTDTQ